MELSKKRGYYIFIFGESKEIPNSFFSWECGIIMCTCVCACEFLQKTSYHYFSTIICSKGEISVGVT